MHRHEAVEESPPPRHRRGGRRLWRQRRLPGGLQLPLRPVRPQGPGRLRLSPLRGRQLRRPQPRRRLRGPARLHPQAARHRPGRADARRRPEAGDRL
ncbi:MAG: hypothetical protein E6I76_08050 [Chloroflexi bacterium]|nr:MAG: hypothetical protein E6I76_08050 [Chloroflexota bacterium]